MPVVGSTAYNTAGQITSLVRSLLNDAAGNLFTDTVLMPYANAAYRKAQRSLANVQSGSFLSDDVLLVVAGVAQVDASAQVSITDATAPPNQLPTDLLVPVKLWERANLSSDDFVEMTDLTDHDGLPSEPQVERLRFWEWRADGLYFLGATQDTQIRLRYQKSFPDLVDGDESGADSQCAGSHCLCRGGHGRSGARRAAGRTLGRGRGGRAGGFGGARDAARAADRAQAQAVFFARRIFVVLGSTGFQPVAVRQLKKTGHWFKKAKRWVKKTAH